MEWFGNLSEVLNTLEFDPDIVERLRAVQQSNQATTSKSAGSKMKKKSNWNEDIYCFFFSFLNWTEIGNGFCLTESAWFLNSFQIKRNKLVYLCRGFWCTCAVWQVVFDVYETEIILNQMNSSFSLFNEILFLMIVYSIFLIEYSCTYNDCFDT